jgi:hypothetical protein
MGEGWGEGENSVTQPFRADILRLASIRAKALSYSCKVVVMRHSIFCCLLGVSLVTMSAFAHEKTGWIAPESAKKMKNPIKLTKASVQKEKEIYEKKCALCNGDKGGGKGPAAAGLNPKPTNFQDSHGQKMTDGEHF